MVDELAVKHWTAANQRARDAYAREREAYELCISPGCTNPRKPCHPSSGGRYSMCHDCRNAERRRRAAK